VNTYDPMDRIVYRHMAPEQGAYFVPVDSARKINRLPSGYTSGSPRTYLRPTRRMTPAA